MPDVTPRLGLKKPLLHEHVTLAGYRENLDLIDRFAARREEVSVELQNRTGAAVAAGDVVVQDPANPQAFVLATGVNPRVAHFVVREAIAANAVGLVSPSGVMPVRCEAGVGIGRWLGPSGTPRVARDLGAAPLPGAFAITLGPVADGVAPALVFNPPIQPAVPAELIGLFLGPCPDGWVEVTGFGGRVPVGVPGDGVIGGTVGTPLGDRALRTISQVPTHSHDVALSSSQEGAHTHGVGTLAVAAEAGHTHPAGGLGTATEGSHTHGVGTLAMGGPSQGHSHGVNLVSGTESVDHAHGFTTGSAGSHQHVAEFVDVLAIGEPGSSWRYRGEFANAGNGGAAAVGNAGAHSHSGTTGGRSAAHTHQVTGSTGDQNQGHTHALSGTTAAGAAHSHGVTGATGAGSSHGHGLSGASAAGSAHGHTVSGATAATGQPTVDVTMPYVQVRFCRQG